MDEEREPNGHQPIADGGPITTDTPEPVEVVAAPLGAAPPDESPPGAPDGQGSPPLPDEPPDSVWLALRVALIAMAGFGHLAWQASIGRFGPAAITIVVIAALGILAVVLLERFSGFRPASIRSALLTLTVPVLMTVFIVGLYAGLVAEGSTTARATPSPIASRPTRSAGPVDLASHLRIGEPYGLERLEEETLAELRVAFDDMPLDGAFITVDGEPVGILAIIDIGMTGGEELFLVGALIGLKREGGEGDIVTIGGRRMARGSVEGIDFAIWAEPPIAWLIYSFEPDQTSLVIEGVVDGMR